MLMNNNTGAGLERGKDDRRKEKRGMMFLCHQARIVSN